MKKITLILLLSIFLLSTSTLGTATVYRPLHRGTAANPGDLITISCSNPYPTLGLPVNLLVTLWGGATEQFNETLTVTDMFSGFVMSEGKLKWISSTVIESYLNITIGKLPKYTRKIPWYPSMVGNHTLQVTAGSSPEKYLNISVGFDVEGIITPSLGCPTIISKDTTTQLSISLSEERLLTDDRAQIVTAQLTPINGPDVYPLENQTDTWSTWVSTGQETVEDELTVSYDVQSIPEGFYNLTVITLAGNYSWPHAVQIIAIEPTQYAVVQLTDIHIGKYVNMENKKQELIRLLTYIGEVVQPAFVVVSGDSIDWYNEKTTRNVFRELQEALLSSTIPLFIVPGNHERYGHSLLFLYTPFTNLTGYHRYLNPLNDYAFHYGKINLILLDSGYDYSRWEIQPQIWNTTPEGSGLTNTQMQLITQVYGDNQTHQLIIMHHLAVSDTNDTRLGAVPNNLPSGNNECIAFNRAEFIDYCLDNNVSIVLSGHTHKNRVLTFLGKEPLNDTERPLFIQTCSSTLSGQNNGGRVIQIQNTDVVSYEYLPFR